MKIELIEKYIQKYYIRKVEIKDYNDIIDGRNFSDQPIKNDLKTYDNIRKIATGQGDDYTTSCLLDYPYFKEYYKLTQKQCNKLISLEIQKKNAAIFFIIEEAKETVLDFSKETAKVLNMNNIIKTNWK